MAQAVGVSCGSRWMDVLREPGQDCGEAVSHRGLESAAGFDDGKDRRGVSSGPLVSDVGPVAAPDRGPCGT